MSIFTWLMFYVAPYNLLDIDEESVAIEEVKALGEVIQEVEQSTQSVDVNTALNQAVH
jgi:hypothetical protein